MALSAWFSVHLLSVVVFGLTFAGEAATLANTGGGDSLCLLQSSVDRHRGPETEWSGEKRTDIDPVCQCLDWQRVYKEYHVLCGQGLEYFAFLGHNQTAMSMTDQRLKDVKSKRAQAGNDQTLGESQCEEYFQKLPKNFGVRIKFSTLLDDAGKHWWDNSWCYVKQECQKLNGGDRVDGTRVNWKITQQGFHDVRDPLSDKTADHTFQQMEPTDLIKMAQHTKIDLTVMFGYAYYTHKYLDIPYFQGQGFGMTANETCEMVVQTGLPTLVVASNKKSTKRVVKGKNVWELEEQKQETKEHKPLVSLWSVKKIVSAPKEAEVFVDVGDEVLSEKMSKTVDDRWLRDHTKADDVKNLFKEDVIKH